MPSKYYRAKKAMLEEFEKERIGHLTEEELEGYLGKVHGEDEDLCYQIRTNWRRATTPAKAKESPLEQEEAAPVRQPEITVEDLGVFTEAEEGEVPEKLDLQEDKKGDAATDVLYAMFLQQRDMFAVVESELMSLRFGVAVLVACFAATFLMVNWGDRFIGMFI